MNTEFGDLDMAMLDWPAEADEVIAAHYSRAVLVVREEFCVEYDGAPQDRPIDRQLQELPCVATLEMARMTCRVHQVGADLLDVRTLRLAHRLDARGWLIPIAESEVVP